MYFFDRGKKFFKSSEEVISMFLGLAIVLVFIGLVFSFFQKRNGDVTVPGVSDNIDISQVEIKDKNEAGNNGQANSSNEYTVVYGDNLWKIAEAKYNNGYAWTELVKANNIKNPSVLKVGQKITVPQLDDKTIASNSVSETANEQIEENSSASNAEVTEYVVVKNDSLWNIAVKTYGDGYKWVQIRDANKNLISNPNIIHAGNKLVLPNLKS